MTRAFGFFLVLMAAVPVTAEPTHFEVLVGEAFTDLAAARAVRGHADAAEVRAETVGAWKDPRVSLSASNVPWRELSLAEHAMSGVELKATQTVPFPGKREARAELVRREAAAMRITAEPWRVRLARMAVGPYFDLVEIEAQVPLLTAKVALLEELVLLAEARYGAGGGRAGDAMRARVEWATLQRRLRVLESARDRAIARFNAALQRAPGTPVKAEFDRWADRPPVASLDELLAAAQENRPEFDTLRARLKVRQQAIEVESYRDRPDFYVGGGWRFRFHDGTLGGRDFFSLLVGVDIPVWSPGVSRGETEGHRAHISGIEDERVALVREIRGRISVLLADLDYVEVERASLDGVELPVVRETLAVLRAEYPTGGSDFLEVLRIELQVVELELRRVQLDSMRARVVQELRIETL
jgi:outer membrane protein TolC